ncbi:MAG TPA: DUF1592 domain-containing protein [Polyangiaceae bacterium]|nr:DUF1592 domain-containing protein [Polyangiaceae bacterium]
MVITIRAALSCSLLAFICCACEAGTGTGGAPRGGSGGSAGAGGGGTLPDGTPTEALLPARIRRLTNAEYDASVRALTATALTPARTFAPDLRQDGYTLNEAQRVDPLLVKQLASAAEAIAAEIKTNLDAHAPCADAAGQGETCATTFIQSFGARGYRRPLDQAESDALLTVYRTAAEGAAYADGIELVASAVLQSAGFLYLTELGDGAGPVVTLTPHELASSLSYLLTEAPPDDALVEAALAGTLSTPEGRAEQARRLLDTAGSERGVRVLREWLGVDRLELTAKDSNVYPEFEAVKASMLAETDAFIEALLGSAGTVGQLLSADSTVADAPLAAMYGTSTRHGVLNQGAFLSVFAHATETGPVLRGVTVARRVACLIIPSPTELDIDVVPPVPDPSKTTRERFAVHSTDPVCAGCHSTIDAFGFAFEHFDGMGKYREMDNGQNVNSAVTLAAGTDFDGDYADSNALALALAESASVRSCFARHVFRASAGTSGALAQASEDAFVAAWQADPTAASGNISETLIAYAKSPLFAQRRLP